MGVGGIDALLIILERRICPTLCLFLILIPFIVITIGTLAGIILFSVIFP